MIFANYFYNWEDLVAVFNQSYTTELFVLSLNSWEGDNAVEYVPEKAKPKKLKRKKDEFQHQLKKYLNDSLQKIAFNRRGKDD